MLPKIADFCPKKWWEFPAIFDPQAVDWVPEPTLFRWGWWILMVSKRFKISFT